MFLRKILLGILCVICSISANYAQLSESARWKHYSFFQEDFRIDSNRQEQLFFRINNLNYFKNNEYKNDFIIGRSLIGLYAEPSIDYYPDDKTRISAGVHLLKFHGSEGYDQVMPSFTVQHKASRHLEIIFGTLRGGANHGLLEPIMSFEKQLVKKNENGFQFIVDYPWLQADLWLNWEQFIKNGDPYQEKFTAGGNVFLTMHEEEQLRVGVPIQMIFRHRGGQIDSSNLPADTKSNQSIGMQIDWFPRADNYLKSISFEHNILIFREINPGGHIQITHGQGMYTLIEADTRLGCLQFGLWQAYNYFSPHGEALFLSSSEIRDENYTPERNMLTIKYQYMRPLTKFMDIAFRFEPYYHFYTGRMDHSWSIYLILDKDFFLRDARNIGRPRRGDWSPYR